MSDPVTVPVIDLAQMENPCSRKHVLDTVLHAVRDFGLFYIVNSAITTEMIEEARQECQAFFDLPMAEKKKLDLLRCPSFLGYATLGSETTANKADWREHLTVAPDVSDPSSGPLYRNLLGPSQWPDPAVLPKFRPAIQGLMDRSTKLTKDMRQLIAEAIGVDINMFESLFKENQQDKLRLIRYPEPPAVADNSEIQSLGAHQDTSFSTLIYQLSEHRCLQALDPRGEWINCPPIPGSIIYVLGQGFNAYTWGFCKACWHRVIPPPPGSGDRHSMAMPSYIGQDVSLKDPKTQEALEYTKEEISKRHPNHKAIVPQYMLEESKYDSAGQRVFSSYVKSFPEVTRRWYPQLLHGHGCKSVDSDAQ